MKLSEFVDLSDLWKSYGLVLKNFLNKNLHIGYEICYIFGFDEKNRVFSEIKFLENSFKLHDRILTMFNN